jgi:hypothetical protein
MPASPEIEIRKAGPQDAPALPLQRRFTNPSQSLPMLFYTTRLAYILEFFLQQLPCRLRI